MFWSKDFSQKKCRVKNFFWSNKNVCAKKMLGKEENFWVKNFGSKKNQGQKNTLSPKELWIQKILGSNEIWVQKEMLVQKHLRSKMFGVKKIFGSKKIFSQKKFRSKKIWSKKFLKPKKMASRGGPNFGIQFIHQYEDYIPNPGLLPCPKPLKKFSTFVQVRNQHKVNLILI